MMKFCFALLAVMVAALPARAENICGMRADVIGKHSNMLAEKPTALGLNAEGRVVEVLSSPDGNTWTIIVTTPDGVSCRIANGKSWQFKPRNVAGAGA